jgi:hemolysin activation/secretion protein
MFRPVHHPLSRARGAGLAAAVALVLPAAGATGPVNPPPLPFGETAGTVQAVEAVPVDTFYIRQYRVRGASKLPRVDVEGAVYRFMGPECTQSHVERARAALEKTYRDAGYMTVSVSVPVQEVRYGVIYLEVTEATIGRLRVKGSRYFDLSKIKGKFPSLAEGTVPNSNDLQHDMLALRYPDLKIEPKINPGAVPGTFDVDLNVQDKLPLHGSLELNNRYSPDTTELRLNGAISYGNLWQEGHTAGLSFQVAPENMDDALVFSGFYTMPIESVEGLSLTITGTNQDSDISTLGGSAVAGRGYMAGMRLSKVLPPGRSYYHTVSAGFDFKHFDQDIRAAGSLIQAPLDYYPFTIGYNGTRVLPHSSTDVNASLVFTFRGMGSDTDEYDNRRYRSDSSFVYLRADASHTQDLTNGMQVFGKVQGQVSSGPLVDSEQFSGGGLGSARGYLESTALGDNALFGSVEVRSRSFIPKPALKEGEMRPSRPNEWRVYAFCDAGLLTVHAPLPEQDPNFSLASVGVGTRFRARDHYNGSLDVGLPLIDRGTTETGDVVVTFRVWADF